MLWYLRAPQNLARGVWVHCTHFYPYFFHFYFHQISVFRYLSSCNWGVVVWNAVECLHLFLWIISNNHALFNGVGDGRLFYFFPIFVLIMQTWFVIFSPSCGLYVSAWWSLNLPRKFLVSVVSTLLLIIFVYFSWWCGEIFLKLIIYYIFYWDDISSLLCVILYSIFVGFHPRTLYGVIFRLYLYFHAMY